MKKEDYPKLAEKICPVLKQCYDKCRFKPEEFPMSKYLLMVCDNKTQLSSVLSATMKDQKIIELVRTAERNGRLITKPILRIKWLCPVEPNLAMALKIVEEADKKLRSYYEKKNTVDKPESKDILKNKIIELTKKLADSQTKNKELEIMCNEFSNENRGLRTIVSNYKKMNSSNEITVEFKQPLFKRNICAEFGIDKKKLSFLLNVMWSKELKSVGYKTKQKILTPEQVLLIRKLWKECDVKSLVANKPTEKKYKWFQFWKW
jgi:hypothetical protein